MGVAQKMEEAPLTMLPPYIYNYDMRGALLLLGLVTLGRVTLLFASLVAFLIAMLVTLLCAMLVTFLVLVTLAMLHVTNLAVLLAEMFMCHGVLTCFHLLLLTEDNLELLSV